MKWLRKLVDKWKKFMEETARANEKMWKGKKPSCCTKEKEREEAENEK